MYWLRITIILLILSWGNSTTVCQTFRCDGSLLIGINTAGNSTTINKVFFGPFGTLSFGATNFYTGNRFNALGFNLKDNFIYAARTGTNEIVRLKSDNTFEVVGTVPFVDSLTTSAGDCTPNGYYICHDQVLDQLLVFDVVDNFALIDRIDLFWAPFSPGTGPFTARIDDLAIDPTNTTIAYSFQGNYDHPDLDPRDAKGYLLSINLDLQSPDVGMVTAIDRVPRDVIRKIGGLMFNEFGVLHGYGSISREPDDPQNELMTINKFTGGVNKFRITGPRGVSVDGCSCPYFIQFTNLVNPVFAPCTNSRVEYTLTITNYTFDVIPDATLIDTFIEGMIITDITGDINGTFAPGTGEGTRFLQLDNLSIPARSSISITLEVDIIDIPIDIISNQAILTNLPDRYDDIIVSDDPATDFVGDETNFLGDPPRLEGFSYEITKPTDCIIANDGSIKLSASALIPGLEYVINMQNEDFAEFERTVTVDAQNTIVLDSLMPGEYRLYKITPVTSSCSFAIKDTTILVEPPNELIRAAVSTNSPICESDTLKLLANVSPLQGSVEWSGPNFFVANDINVSLAEAAPELSGEYEMIFSYGFCEQIRTLEVEVAPAIEARIESEDSYCERDSVRLIATGEGTLNQFTWTKDNSLLANSNIVEISSATIEEEGIYKVVIGNGSCFDTTSKFITINPSPTLNLPSSVESDFCTPLLLNPEVIGSGPVTYDWFPEEGLSCADCPNPQVLIPFNEQYQLRVSNEFSCQDSADISIRLNKEELIFVPNVFSPNADGVNDFFQVFPNCGVLSLNGFRIFDRFGSLVYALDATDQFSDPRDFWDGRLNSSRAQTGVYVWQIELTLIDGSILNLAGDVTLVR